MESGHFKLNPHWLKLLIATLGLLTTVGLGCDTNNSSIDVPDIPDEEEPTDTTGQGKPIGTGGRVAFTVFMSNGDIDVYLGDYFRPTDAHKISPEGKFTAPRFSRDGSMITVVSYQGSFSQLLTPGQVPANRQLPDFFKGYSVSWSRDNRIIYYDTPNGAVETNDVIKFSLDDWKVAELSRTLKVLTDFRGDSLLVRNAENGLLAYDPLTGNTRKLSNSVFDSSTFRDALDWDEESDMIVFSHFGDGTSYVSLASPDGHFIRRITDGKYHDWRPRFGPSGWVLFDRTSDTKFESERIMKYGISGQIISTYLDTSAFTGAVAVGGVDYSQGK